MPNRRAQLFITILFIALLGGLALWGQFGSDDKDPGKGQADAGALGRYGFRLQEVARTAGIDFMHQAPKLDARLDHIMPQVASMGAGVAIADFDRDGWQDFYVTNSGEDSPNKLYRNVGDGTFKDVAATMGVANVNAGGIPTSGTASSSQITGVSMGAVWGDMDNDGWEDLFVYKWGRPELFRNEGGKRFTRVTQAAGLPHWINANTAVWLDYDRDGRLDLFIGGYYPDDVNLWQLRTTRMMPDSFEYAQNGGRKYLLRNIGDDRFEDVTEARRHSQSALGLGRGRQRSR